MAAIVSRDRARRERLEEGGVDNEAATAIGDVFTSFSEQLDEIHSSQREEFARTREEFGRLLNIHTGIIVVGLAAIGLLIGAVAVFG